MNVRILHHHEPPHGWWFNSPDVPGMSGAADSYADSVTRAEDAARFTIECLAEENGQPAPDVSAVEFEHFVNDPAAAIPAVA